MLNKDTLNKFTKEANKGRSQFCVWMYTYNNFVKHQEKFNSEVKDGLYPDDEAIKNSCKYKNFWDITIPSLQHGRILSVARLIDPPYFGKNISKENLSIHYIKKLLEDDSLKVDIENNLNKQKDFIKSIKEIRNTLLAHNNIGENNNVIFAGVENFFKSLNNIILQIKERYPNLKDCNDINLEYTEKLSEAGVKEIFEKII